MLTTRSCVGEYTKEFIVGFGTPDEMVMFHSEESGSNFENHCSLIGP